ncbi:MAG: hypothetical protein FWC23_07480 [Chitinispirillia bacterium]|nr:hypothetical protein [Chitinispirillia bacterium]MCL2269010.1 hypothetical protein [Chitinispirillia bacterium]
MCEISEVFDIKDITAIVCTPYDGDYAGSNRARIRDAANNVFVISEFVLEKFTVCFGNLDRKPNIGIGVKNNIHVPENFLRRGNKVELYKE